MILAGDVGGTKVHLALYDFAGGRLSAVRDHKFPAHEFAALEDVVKSFLAAGEGQTEQVVAACFGCPGPVRDGRLKLTNLPWTLDARDLQRSLGIDHIFLINDLEANGYGIPELAADKVMTLHAGDAKSEWPPSDGSGRWLCVFASHTSSASPRPVPAETSPR
jgi:glucokinase